LVIVKENHMNICLIMNGYLQRELFESTYTKALWKVIKKDKLLTANCILILI
jgi:hypothetical protein